MKYLQFILLLILPIILIGQEERQNILCNTSFDYLAPNAESYEIRLTFNFKDNITPLSDSEIISLVDDVNVFYQNHGISFMWDCNANIISSDVTKIDSKNALDINVYADFGDSGTEFIPDTKIKMSKEDLNQISLSHELGHCLGLLHTHTSTSPDNFTGSSGASTCAEDPLQTLSNCETCGDCLCDTPADPNLDVGTNPSYLDGCNYVGNATYNGNPYNPLTNNLMSYAGDCRNQFIPAQSLRMRNFIENVSYLNNLLIHRDKSFVENVLLFDGESLNIAGTCTVNGTFAAFQNSSVFMAEDAELILTGNTALFSKSKVFGCNWKSINITSNAPLDIKKSSICGGETAIIYNGNSTESFTIEDNIFKNNNTAIKIEGRSNNNDILKGNQFSDGEVALDLTNSDFNLEGNSFTNLSFRAIDATGSHINVVPCDDANCFNSFEDCGYGIVQSFPSGLSKSTRVEGYNFTNMTSAAVLTLGGSGTSNSQKITLENNTVDGGLVGFSFSGASTYNMRNNTIEGTTTPIWLTAAGPDFNEVTNNVFNGTDRSGSVFLFDNRNTDLVTNCYGNHSFTDVYVHDLFLDQGNNQVSNGNCFGSVGKELYSSGVSGSFFTYFEPNSQAQGSDCQEVNSSGNFEILQADIVISADDCGSSTGIAGGGTGGGSTSGAPDPPTGDPDPNDPPYTNDPINGPCNPDQTEVAIMAAQQEIIAIIDDINNNTSLTQQQRDRLLLRYNNCFRNNAMTLVDVLRDEGSETEAMNYLANQSDFTLRVKPYTVLVSEGNYSQASTYLQSMAPVSNDEHDFVFTQEILLMALQNSAYTPTPSILSSIEQIGVRKGAINGYARAVYHYFTGTILEVPYIFDTVRPRSSGKSNKHVRVYPKILSSGSLLSVRFEGNDSVDYFIYDVNGNLINKGKLVGGKGQIEMNEVPGIYFISFPNQSKVEKFVIVD